MEKVCPAAFLFTPVAEHANYFGMDTRMDPVLVTVATAHQKNK